MFWNRACTIFIICLYWSIYGLIESLTPNEITKICDDTNNNNNIIAHTNDKRAFIACDKKSIETCAPKTCYKENSPCVADECPPEMPPQDMLGLCSGQPDFTMMPTTNNQNKFILCTDNDAVPFECPYEKCFDKKTQRCDENACSTTADNPPNTVDDAVKRICQSNDDTYFKKIPSDNCETYYVCMGMLNEPLHKVCPSNLHYSEELEICTSPMEAECNVPRKWCVGKENGVKFAAENCYDYYECTNGLAVSQSCSYDEHFAVDQSKCMKGFCLNKNGVVRQPSCADREDGVFIEHPSCNKFFVCSSDGLYEGHCTSGYYFNARLKQCVRDIKNNCKV